MGSIRPIITLTIIVVAGVFLFRKINEGPAQLTSTGETFQSATAGDAPALAMSTPGATGGAPAPAWTDSTTAAPPAAPKWTEPATEETASVNPPVDSAPVATSEPTNTIEETTAPGIPPIPALPPLAEVTTPAETAPAATPTFPTTTPLDPPASIPTARYDSDTSAQEMTPPTATPFGATADATSTPASSYAEANPAAEAASPEDRYGATAPTAEPSAASETPSVAQTAEQTSPVAATSPLASSWPEIQTALDRQELAQAHQMLSQFYGNPSLSPTESQQVEALLSQLAGTVVYSTEHRLEPPYVVHPGETLETIAAKYEVPWQLLAKINGISASNLVQPGQELKVIHGPFSAVVELGRGQMTLLLGNRYAGRFPIITEPTATGFEGQWTLEQKLVNPSAPADGVVSASYDSSTATVDRMLVLRSESAPAGVTTISIASGLPTPSGPTAVAPAAFRVSPQDAEELADILSVGSRIVIRK